MPPVEVREYIHGDEDVIIPLFGSTFGREMTRDEWHWKYRGLGNERVCSAVLTNERNEIVGHYGGIPVPMSYRGRDVTGVSCCDVMITPEYRGIWALRKLHRFFIDVQVTQGISMIYGFPTDRTLLQPAEKAGLYERIETVLEASKEPSMQSGRERFLYRLVPLAFDDDGIDALWASASLKEGLAVRRDKAYFNWRYTRHPLFSYEIWGLAKRWSNMLTGLVVLKQERSDNLLIMDMVYRDEMLVPLLMKTETLAFRYGKKKMSLWLPQRLHMVLGDIGFSLEPSGATLPRSTHKATLTKEEIASQFYYTCGDTDFL